MVKPQKDNWPNSRMADPVGAGDDTEIRRLIDVGIVLHMQSRNKVPRAKMSPMTSTVDLRERKNRMRIELTGTTGSRVASCTSGWRPSLMIMAPFMVRSGRTHVSGELDTTTAKVCCTHGRTVETAAANVVQRGVTQYTVSNGRLVV